MISDCVDVDGRDHGSGSSEYCGKASLVLRFVYVWHYVSFFIKMFINKHCSDQNIEKTHPHRCVLFL